LRRVIFLRPPRTLRRGEHARAPRTQKKKEHDRGDFQKRQDDPLQEAIDLVVETADALHNERGDEERLWGSMIKQALKRRRPGFNESYYGVRSFNKLLEEAQTRGYVDLELDERSGGYIVRRVAVE
jgi:hypothetical protein